MPIRIEQSNYTDYLVPRIDITLETHVYFVETTHLSGGVGEPGVPPTAGDLQRDLRRHRQTDQGATGRSATAAALELDH
ncbi:MAG: hypothetical protein WA633_28670 [Stellaceae bacterium]